MQLSIVNLLIYREMQLSIVYPVIWSVRARAWIFPPTCDAEIVINFGYPNVRLRLIFHEIQSDGDESYLSFVIAAR